MLKRFKKHFRLWKRWQKYCLNKRGYKLLVLFGVVTSPTFHLMKMFEYK